ncbi:MULTISPECIES: holo-ACP synthase [Gracilibacillus]|uniref:holo-ACP synthase n=1 Tax=Gracilibacillus TaxID=74385 RepID=UPI000825D37E|nr:MULTISPECIES: holo-ACP synthase [Gracilibacillus]
MIEGIGIDIIELHRIRAILERQPRIVSRLLTEREQTRLAGMHSAQRKIEFIAGRFAAKEAFSKALGTGIGKISFTDIEIGTDYQGAPILTSAVLAGASCFVSISHSKEYAIAQVIIERESAY